MTEPLSYQQGFGNCFETEAIEGALVKGQNSPQKVPFGLYTEQFSGTAFTTARHLNLRSWLYRIRPSVLHNEFFPISQKNILGTTFGLDYTPPTQMRWDPMPYPKHACNFIEGLMTFAGNGSIEMHKGAAIHLYCATKPMQNEF